MWISPVAPIKVCLPLADGSAPARIIGPGDAPVQVDDATGAELVALGAAQPAPPPDPAPPAHAQLQPRSRK